MPPEQSEGGINFCEVRRNRSGRHLVVAVSRWSDGGWLGRSATAQEGGKVAGQANTISIGMGEAGRKTRDDIGGKLGGNIGGIGLRDRHGARRWGVRGSVRQVKHLASW